MTTPDSKFIIHHSRFLLVFPFPVVSVILVIHLRTVILVDPFCHKADDAVGHLQLAVGKLGEVVRDLAVINRVFVPCHVVFLHVVANQCNQTLLFISFREINGFIDQPPVYVRNGGSGFWYWGREHFRVLS